MAGGREEIKGYRVGTSRHRRALPEDLAIFLKKNNISFPTNEKKGIGIKPSADNDHLPTFFWEVCKNTIDDHILPDRNGEECPHLHFDKEATT